MSTQKFISGNKPVARRVVIDYALDRDFTRVGRSRIEGKGLFAKRKIPKGARIIEYKGKRRKVIDLLTPGTHGEVPNVYLFHLSEEVVVDGLTGGNDARYINHSCEPNCEALMFNGKIYLYALQDIPRGEELTYNYQMRPLFGGEQPVFEQGCRCGSAQCSGSMMATNPSTLRSNQTPKRRHP